MSDTPKEVRELEEMTGQAAQKLGRYGENHHEEAWLVPEEGSDSIEVVYGGALGYNNCLDGTSAVDFAAQLVDDPAFIVQKHANSCGGATRRDFVGLMHDPSVAKNEYSANGQAFLRAWAGDTMSAMGSIIASTRPLTVEIAKMINNRVVDVLFVPDVEGAAIDELRAHDERKKAKDPNYGRTLKVVVTDGIGKPMPESYARRWTRFGWLVDKKTPRISLAEDLTDLFKQAEMRHCDNSGKDLMVGVVSEKAPSPERAGLYAFGITAAKSIKSNAIVIVREYGHGSYQILGMGAGQPNRKDAAMLAGRKAEENVKREYFRLHGRAMIKSDKSATVLLGGKVPARWETAMEMLERIDSLQSLRLDYMADEEVYVRETLGGNNVLVTSDAFFPKPDGLDELLATGVRNVISPGGAKRDADVIARADERGATLIHTGVRYFLH